MKVRVEDQKVGPTMRHNPTPLFPIAARNNEYDVSPDGKRFLVNTNAGVPPRPLTVTTQWSSAIRR